MVRSASRLVLAGVLVFSGASAATAQSHSDQQAAVQTIAAVGQHVWTDLARVDNAGQTLYIAGWGFECSSGSQGAVSVVLDGIELATPFVVRIERWDVRLWAITNNVCDFAHTPAYSGINVFIDARSLAPGLHTATLKISNDAGVSTVSPKSMAFVMPSK
jgi:hypothetical protein